MTELKQELKQEVDVIDLEDSVATQSADSEEARLDAEYSLLDVEERNDVSQIFEEAHADSEKLTDQPPYPKSVAPTQQQKDECEHLLKHYANAVKPAEEEVATVAARIKKLKVQKKDARAKVAQC